GGGAGGYSQTNVQVQGVDEADFVKTDGNFIYDLTSPSNRIRPTIDSGTSFWSQNMELDIVQVGPGNAMQIVSRTPIEGFATALYVIGNNVTIISSVQDASVDPDQVPRTVDGFPLLQIFAGKMKVTVLD